MLLLRCTEMQHRCLVAQAFALDAPCHTYNCLDTLHLMTGASTCFRTTAHSGKLQLREASEASNWYTCSKGLEMVC